MLSSIFFLNQNSVQYLWIQRDLVTNVLYEGPDRAIIGCCNFTQAKSREVCIVLLDKGLFLKNRTFATKRSVWPSSTLKTVDLQYRSSLSVCLDGQVLVQKLHNLGTTFHHIVTANLSLNSEFFFSQTTAILTGLAGILF